MKTKIASGMCIAACIATGFAQSPVVTDEMQQFLNVPVWYLTYSISVRMTGPGETAGYTIHGRMMMGLRSQGASLSQMSGEAPRPTIDPNLIAQIMSGKQPVDPAQLAALATQASSQLNTMVAGYATWMFGANYDKSKTDAENEAEQKRVRLEDKQQALKRFWWLYDGPSSAEGGRDHNEGYGSGPMLHSAEPTIEIDGTRKRYKLLFEPRFADTLQSVEAVNVVMEHGIGTKDYNRQHFKRPLSTLPKGTIESYDPELPRIFEGNLPAKLGAFSATSTYAVKSQGLSGTCMFSYSISPTPPEDVELLIEPPAEYENWRPVGGEDEETAGDFVPIKIHFQKKGGGVPKTKATRFTYRLIDTSHEKGVCMNWPVKPLAKSPRDLQFEPSRNPNLTIGDNERQSASNDGAKLVDDEVVVSCFDYGATSTFTAEAELEDGRIILGTVKGAQLEYLNLPKRETGSRIASVFFKEAGIGNLPDDDDSENDPIGDGFKGDGLTLYEEYRGFKHGDGWVTGDPKVKDIFVVNGMGSSASALRGIQLFTTVTRLNTHQWLRPYQVNFDRAINFNYTDGPHVVDQHVIFIFSGIKISQGANAAHVDVVGTPGTAQAVHMPPDWDEFRTTRRGTYDYFAATLAHEMLHDCNVYHHGQADETVKWRYVAGPPAQVVESDYGPITVKDENENVIQPADGFPDPANLSSMEVWIGVDHGQHSGAEDCLMRYDCALAYRSKSDPSVRYLSGGESTGMGFCVTTAGTGVNSISHRPQSRYGSAAPPGGDIKAQRGNCKFQLRVNDLDLEPQR